jgi:hypothetical protein
MEESRLVPVLPVGDSISPEGALYLNCPRCGLTITPKVRWLAVEHCPRCIARRGAAIKMLRMTLPADGLASGPWLPARERTLPGAQAG